MSPTPLLYMLNLSQLNAERLKNSYWETQLKKFDPSLYVRFDEIKSKWLVFEYYPENVYIKPLFWLEDADGNSKEFGQWVLNKLNVMRLNWEHKEKVGTNTWFDELEKEADRQYAEMEEKQAEENRYAIKSDKLQWRKGARELLNKPTSDVFAGYQFNPEQKKRGLDVKCETSPEPPKV